MPYFATFSPVISKVWYHFEIYDFGIGSIAADGLTSGYPGHLKALLRNKVSQTRGVLLLEDFPLEVTYKIAEARDKKIAFDYVTIKQPNREFTLKSARIVEHHHYVPHPEIVLEFKSKIMIQHTAIPDPSQC